MGVRLRVTGACLLAALVVGGLAPAAGASRPEAASTAPAGPIAPPATPPDLDTLDPVRFGPDETVVESLQITTRTGTPVGTGTGASPTDVRIWVDVIRPDTDEPVPTILIASPYYETLGRGWRGEGKERTGDQPVDLPGYTTLAGAEPASRVPFPEWYDEYFVGRGYAVALMDLRGTRNSDGCQVYGDRDEVVDVVDVIDHLVELPWSNGKVGMTGGSYDGTVAIGAAAEMPISGEHPDALAAIIPIRAIGRWYDYHFFNGVQSGSHLLTPALFTAVLAGEDEQTQGLLEDPQLAFSLAERKACIPTIGAATAAGYASPYQDADGRFWAERDFTKDAGGFRAATFLVSGLFDYNVKNNNTGYLWSSLPEDLPRKLWFANMDHADPHIPTSGDAGSHVVPFPYQERFVEATHRWYLQFLKGVEAGATDGPPVEVQRADGSWDGGEAFPAANGDLVLYPAADGTAATVAPKDTTPLAWRDGMGSSAPSAAVVVSDPFATDTRLSGQFGFDLDVSTSGVDTSIAVEIALVAPGAESLEAGIPFVAGSDAVTASYAWLRTWYRDTVPMRGVSTPSGGGPMLPGVVTDVSFGSLPTDLVIPTGWRLRFTFSNRAGGTVAANLGGTVQVHAGGSRILVPVVDPVAEPVDGADAPPPPPLPTTGSGGAIAALGLALLVGVRSRRRH